MFEKRSGNASQNFMVNKGFISEHKLNTPGTDGNHTMLVRTRDTGAADAIFTGVQSMLSDLGWTSLREVTLANSRRADILAMSRKGEFAIIEVKSCLGDFTSDSKWPDYRDYCDLFYFAVNAEFPQEKVPTATGLIVADAFNGAILREGERNKLAAARRKAITQTFARLAASRLYRIQRDALA